jgi:hypothetical protein
VQYDSDDSVDKSNVASFTMKVVKKLQDEGRKAIFKNGRFRCPFDDGKPRDGKRFSLVQHAEQLAATGDSSH